MDLKVFGALIHGYTQACLNLNIISGRDTDKYINNIDIVKWYPLSIWTDLEKIVTMSYQDADQIMIRVGIEYVIDLYLKTISFIFSRISVFNNLRKSA